MLEKILNWYKLKKQQLKTKQIWSTDVFIQVSIEMDLLYYWNLLIWERATPNKNNTFFANRIYIVLYGSDETLFSLSNIGFASLDCLF